MTEKAKLKRAKFSRRMSSDELVDWLHNRGVGESDRKKFKENGFTGESFLLIEDGTMKEMGIKMAGQMLIKKLRVEAETTPEDGDPLSVPFPANDPSNNLNVEPNTENPIGRKSPTTSSTEIHNPLTMNVPSGSGGQTDVHREEPTSQRASSDVSRIEEPSTDSLREEEEAPPYCTTGPYEGASVFSFDHTIQMYRDKVWAGRQVLRVFFLNPDFVTRWGLTKDTIMEWAAVWQQSDDDLIPQFKENTVAKKADIRVKFSETEGCWSAVGMDAEKIVTQDEPTMMLNLKGFPLVLQRSLVIHQFGHALGLDHEHQWSEFWDVVDEFFDESKIGEGQMLRVKKREDMIDKEGSSPYDRHSIMHYWFDPQWLRPAYRDVENVKKLNELSRTEKKYLTGVHRRQGATVLPKFPSNADFEQLHLAYMNPGPKEVPSTSSAMEFYGNRRPPFNRSQSSLSSVEENPGPEEVSTTRSVMGSHGNRRPPFNRSKSSLSSVEENYGPEEVSSTRFVMGSHGETQTYPVRRNSSLSSQEGAVILSADVHLRAIKNAVWEARAKWREIGLALRFTKDDLAVLTGDAGANLERVLLMWMYRGTATVDQLLDALRSNRVRERGLADKILKTRDLRTRKELGLQ